MWVDYCVCGVGGGKGYVAPPPPPLKLLGVSPPPPLPTPIEGGIKACGSSSRTGEQTMDYLLHEDRNSNTEILMQNKPTN